MVQNEPMGVEKPYTTGDLHNISEIEMALCVYGATGDAQCRSGKEEMREVETTI